MGSFCTKAARDTHDVDPSVRAVDSSFLGGCRRLRHPNRDPRGRLRGHDPVEKAAAGTGTGARARRHHQRGRGGNRRGPFVEGRGGLGPERRKPLVFLPGLDDEQREDVPKSAHVCDCRGRRGLLHFDVAILAGECGPGTREARTIECRQGFPPVVVIVVVRLSLHGEDGTWFTYGWCLWPARSVELSTLDTSEARSEFLVGGAFRQSSVLRRMQSPPPLEECPIHSTNNTCRWWSLIFVALWLSGLQNTSLSLCVKD